MARSKRAANRFYPEEASSSREAIEIATTIAEQEGWEGEPASFEETEGEPGWAIR